MGPRISVLMSAYNNATYLASAIESILRQSFRDFELIITDDGSTDGTAVILRYYAARDRRVRIIRNDTNLGLTCSLNNMIDVAAGQYIARMDDDDIALPLRLARQMELLESGVHACGTWLYKRTRLRDRLVRYPSSDSAIRVHLLFENPIPHPTLMLEGRLFKDICRYSASAPYAEDLQLYAELSEHCRMANVPEGLHVYRLHRRQISHVQRLTQWEVAARVRQAHMDRMGICASEPEKSAHALLSYPGPLNSKDDVDHAEYWLLKLVAHFAPCKQAQRIVAQQWFKVAIRASAFGLWTWRRFTRSSLTDLGNFSSTQVGELCALCALRVRFKSNAYGMLLPFTST